MLKPYIYQKARWPQFKWDKEALLPLLGKVRNMQGRLMGKMEGLGFRLRSDALLATLTQEVIKSSEIEGELLDASQVRSSIARKLGMKIAGLVPSDRDVDGMVEMMLDATQHYKNALHVGRLCRWQGGLFPDGRSGMYKIVTGRYRNDSTGPMQVVSGALGKEKVHFEAPPATVLKDEMKRLLSWVNSTGETDPVLKAAIAHLWFITLHPFDDGNGRVARAITDMLLARSDESSQRFYSMSAQIKLERKAYYDILEKTQKGTLDITPWLTWFMHCLLHSFEASEVTLSAVLFKADFWQRHAGKELNPRQKRILNKLHDGFDGKLTSSKWAKICKCSADTALRDIQDLVQKKMLQKEAAGGRSTNYELVRNR